MRAVAGLNEGRAKRLIDDKQFRAAYDLLSSQSERSAREAYYLAFCFGKLHPEARREAVRLFDAAEQNGFSDQWLYYHRCQLLTAIGDRTRALDDAASLLDKASTAAAIDVALRALSCAPAAGVVERATAAEKAIQRLIGLLWQRIKQQERQRSVSNRQIAMVDKGDFRAFSFVGDMSAFPTPNHKTLPPAPVSARQFVESWDKSGDLILLLLAWYVAERVGTAFLDVGSNLGSDAIRAAKFCRLIGEQFPVVAFEPGVMAQLVPHNLKLNEVDDLVTFEEKCVSNDNKPVVLFGEVGQSTNNRIVNRRVDLESFSKIVDAVPLTQYLTAPQFRGRHPVMKIDTQGAEWLVWNGLKKEAATRSMSLVMELTPWALRPFVHPPEFVAELLKSFYIFNLGAARDRCVHITGDRIGDLIAAVDHSGPKWTDILCISRSLPSAQRLMQRLAAAFAKTGA